MHGRTTSRIFYVRAGSKRKFRLLFFLERSPELATAALAVLKAGGAYVPLDPTSPTTRLAMLLEDSAVPPVLTQPDIVEQTPAGKWRRLCSMKIYPSG